MCPDAGSDRHRHDVVDSDVDLHDPLQLAETRPHEWDLLTAIALGGVAGSQARYGVGRLLPHTARQFPWGTLLVNVSGCLLIGVLMVLVLEVFEPHRLLRPFLGVGVLGGYTTFSSFGVDAVQLIRAHRPLMALAYVLASVGVCLTAVWAGSTATRRLALAGSGDAVNRDSARAPGRQPAGDGETERAR